MCLTAVRIECSTATIAFFCLATGRGVGAGTEVRACFWCGRRPSCRRHPAIDYRAGCRLTCACRRIRGAQGRPRTREAGARRAKAGHVTTGLRDDDLNDGLTDPGKGDQVLKLASEGRISCSIHLESSRITADSCCGRCAPGAASTGRCDDHRSSRSILPATAGSWCAAGPCHLGQHVHIAFTVDQRTEHGPPGDTDESLIPASLNYEDRLLHTRGW
jgi:hypothetical protein